MKLVVFHPVIPGSGTSTTFNGPDLHYRLEEDGSLTVERWRTEHETGLAVFAPGQWTYACYSRPLVEP